MRHEKFIPYRRAVELQALLSAWKADWPQNHGLLMRTTVHAMRALADGVNETEDRRALRHLARAEKFLRRVTVIIETHAHHLRFEHVEEALRRVTALILAVRTLEKMPRSEWLDHDPMPPPDVVSRVSNEGHEQLREHVAGILLLKERDESPVKWLH